MRSLIMVALVSMMAAACTGKRDSLSKGIRSAVQIFDPLFIQNNGTDSYRYRLVLYDQQREEEGFFDNNGIWTAREKVFSYNPGSTNNQTETFESDDKGKRVKSSNEPVFRAPPLGACLGSLCG